MPIVPFSREDPPMHDRTADFFEEWGRRLFWPDKDMLYRPTWERAALVTQHMRVTQTVVHTHHLGLRLGCGSTIQLRVR